MRVLLLAAGAFVLTAGPAGAWTRPAHMVTAAIAFDQLEREAPELVGPLGELLDAHPDRGPFEVAIDRAEGTERIRRMFLECARWPDDIRRTAQDRPAWHASLAPLGPDAAGRSTHGAAAEAFALNYRVLADPAATSAERAQALCWVLHIGGDAHQPLHAAQWFSDAFPDGDRSGGFQYVRDPLTGRVTNLHWLWDDAVHRQGDVDSVTARATELAQIYPRAQLPEALASAAAGDFPGWLAGESLPLARDVAYGPALRAGSTLSDAPRVPETYWAQVREISARRVSVAGYRLGDLVRQALAAN